MSCVHVFCRVVIQWVTSARSQSTVCLSQPHVVEITKTDLPFGAAALQLSLWCCSQLVRVTSELICEHADVSLAQTIIMREGRHTQLTADAFVTVCDCVRSKVMHEKANRCLAK